MIRFGISFPEICFENFFNFELTSQIYFKIKEFDYLFKNQQFLFEYIQKIHLFDEKKCRVVTFINYPSFVTYVGNNSYFYSKLQVVFLLAIAFVCFLFIWKIYVPKKVFRLDSTIKTKMNIFVIGNDNM